MKTQQSRSISRVLAHYFRKFF